MNQQPNPTVYNVIVSRIALGRNNTNRQPLRMAVMKDAERGNSKQDENE
jgi:hypothetical protein